MSCCPTVSDPRDAIFRKVSLVSMFLRVNVLWHILLACCRDFEREKIFCLRQSSCISTIDLGSVIDGDALTGFGDKLVIHGLKGAHVASGKVALWGDDAVLFGTFKIPSSHSLSIFLYLGFKCFARYWILCALCVFHLHLYLSIQEPIPRQSGLASGCNKIHIRRLSRRASLSKCTRPQT